MSGEAAAADRPTLVLVTADLFLGSRLKGIGEQAGYQVVTARRLSDRAGGEPPERIVIDLATSGGDLAAALERVGDDPSRVAAYAAHVRIDLLKAARAAGLSAVFTRGQVEEKLPVWLSAG